MRTHLLIGFLSMLVLGASPLYADLIFGRSTVLGELGINESFLALDPASGTFAAFGSFDGGSASDVKPTAFAYDYAGKVLYGYGSGVLWAFESPRVSPRDFVLSIGNAEEVSLGTPITLTVSRASIVGIDHLTGLAFDTASNRLFGVSPGRELIELDPTDGSVTSIGLVGLETTGLAIDPTTGQLLSLLKPGSSLPTQLISISPDTAEATRLPIAGFDDVLGLALDRSTEVVLGVTNEVATLNSVLQERQIIEIEAMTGIAMPHVSLAPLNSLMQSFGLRSEFGYPVTSVPKEFFFVPEPPSSVLFLASSVLIPRYGRSGFARAAG